MDLLVAAPWVLFGLLAALLIFRMIKYGGLSGALLKSRITRTVGSVDVIASPDRLRIKVHSLKRQQPGWVGVEFQGFNDDSSRNSPLTLSSTEALELARLLSDAARSA